MHCLLRHQAINQRCLTSRLLAQAFDSMAAAPKKCATQRFRACLCRGPTAPCSCSRAGRTCLRLFGALARCCVQRSSPVLCSPSSRAAAAGCAQVVAEARPLLLGVQRHRCAVSCCLQPVVIPAQHCFADTRAAIENSAAAATPDAPSTLLRCRCCFAVTRCPHQARRFQCHPCCVCMFFFLTQLHFAVCI